MHPRVSFFDQAADKLREAMDNSASGIDRMRLIQEALTLYHLHQRDFEVVDADMAAHAEPPAANAELPSA